MKDEIEVIVKQSVTISKAQSAMQIVQIFIEKKFIEQNILNSCDKLDDTLKQHFFKNSQK